MLNQIVWSRPAAGLTAKQAARTPEFLRARAAGVGIVDAIKRARWNNAGRVQALAAIKSAKRRSAAARKGWKTRRKK